MLTAALFSLLVATGPASGPNVAFTAQDYDPPVKVRLNKRNARMGEEVRAYVRADADGYVVVLHAEPDGRVRVLFPLDPRYDNYVRGGDEFELRGRGDRRAFRVYAAEGVGELYAAYSRDPFDFTGFTRGDHWDYSIPEVWRVLDDAEAELTDIVLQMAAGAYFDYDLVGYDVHRAYAYGRSNVSVGLHFGSYYPSYGFGYGHGYRCSRWGLRVAGFWYNSGCYNPYYYGYYYDPFYYDPFFYDPFYYNSFYYRPYYYGPTIIYAGGVRRGRGRIIERYTFKSTDERFRTTNTRQRFLGENPGNRRIPTVSSGRVSVATRPGTASSRRRVAPSNSQPATNVRRQPVVNDRRAVTDQFDNDSRRSATGRRTPTVRTPAQTDRTRRTPVVTPPSRRTPSSSARSSGSTAPPRRVVKPDTRPTDRAAPERTDNRRVTPDSRRVTPDNRRVTPESRSRTTSPASPGRVRVTPPSRVPRAAVQRSGARTTRGTTPRTARPSTSSSRRPAVNRSSSRPTVRQPARSTRRPTARPAPSSSRRPAVSRPSTSSSRSRPAASSSRSRPSRGSVSRSSGSSRRSSPSRSSGSRRKP